MSLGLFQWRDRKRGAFSEEIILSIIWQNDLKLRWSMRGIPLWERQNDGCGL